MKKRITLYADEGMIITDGEHFGRTIVLGTDISPDGYREITEAEYEKIKESQDVSIQETV